MIIVGIIVVAIVLAVFLFIIFAPPKFSEENILKDPSAAMTFCQKISGDKQPNCYLKIAEVLVLNNTDIALQACLAINKDTNNGDRKNCIEDLANKQTEQLKAVEICNAFKDDTRTKEHCYGGIMANSPSLSTDTQLAMCDSKTGTDKDNCYRGVAEDFLTTNPTKTVEICKKIQNNNLRDNCLENIISLPEVIKANSALGINICDSVTLKSRCFNSLAQTLSGSDPKQAAEVCKKLSDDVQISNCYGNVWFAFDSVVLQNPDFTISLCNALTIKKDDCLRRTAVVFVDTNKTKTAEICRLMSASASLGCLQSV